MLKREELEYRLKELEMSKQTLARKLRVTPMTLHNKFNDPSSFKLSELELMVRVGFVKSLTLEI